MDADLTKAEIRELSRHAGLPTWDRPAAACLSSRIPYGTPVTIENIKTVEIGEEEIKALGFRQFRTRFHGELVRIEIAPEELPRALDVGNDAAVDGDLQAAGVQVRHARSGRLPAGFVERSSAGWPGYRVQIAVTNRPSALGISPTIFSPA